MSDWARMTPEKKNKHAAACLKWSRENRDRVNAINKKWRDKNPEKFRECVSRYYYSHREDLIAKAVARIREKKARDPEYAAKCRLGTQRWYYSKEGREWFRKYRNNNRKKQRKFAENWRINNPDKISAHNAVYRALNSGTLVRPKHCSRCPYDAKIEAHHNDYRKPLEVTWLCRKCHVIIHPHVKKPVANK
jgi:hypothetical protein